MNIEVKYVLNQEVYVVFKEDDGLIRVSKDKVKEICIREDDIYYYLNGLFEEFKEDELVEYGNHTKLINKIESLIKEEENK